MKGAEFVRKYAPHLDELSQRREGLLLDAAMGVDAAITKLRDHYAEKIRQLAAEHNEVGAALMYLGMFAAAEQLRLGPENEHLWPAAIWTRVEQHDLVNPKQHTDLVKGQVNHEMGGNKG